MGGCIGSKPTQGGAPPPVSTKYETKVYDKTPARPSAGGGGGAEEPKNERRESLLASAGGAAQALVKEHAEGSRPEIVYEGIPGARGTRKAKTLGAGGTATVFEVTHRTSHKKYACKLVKLSRISDQAKRKMLLDEIQICKRLDHPNICKVVEVFVQPDEVYIIMDLCTGGELFDKLYDQPGDKFSEGDGRYLAEKALGALAYLHKNGIAHRDLKLENFIFDTKKDDAEMKLIDFGFSKGYLEDEGHEMHDSVGTPYYLAPEVLQKNYTEASDLWSFGVVFYMLVVGECPFGGNTTGEIVAQIRKRASDPAAMQVYFRNRLAKKYITKPCTEFIMGLLTVDPAKRLTAESAMDMEYIVNKSADVQTLGGPALSAAEEAEDESMVVASLKRFKELGKLKQNALMAVSFELGTDDLHKLNASFAKMDENNDGLISFQEFQNMMTANGVVNHEINAAFEAIDQDNTGYIKYTEFIAAAMKEKAIYSEDVIKSAFHRLDLDDSGFITVDNLVSMLPKDLEEDQVAELVNVSDANGDGKIDFGEFKQIMSGEVGGQQRMKILKLESVAQDF